MPLVEKTRTSRIWMLLLQCYYVVTVGLLLPSFFLMKVLRRNHLSLPKVHSFFLINNIITHIYILVTRIRNLYLGNHKICQLSPKEKKINYHLNIMCVHKRVYILIL